MLDTFYLSVVHECVLVFLFLMILLLSNLLNLVVLTNFSVLTVYY